VLYVGMSSDLRGRMWKHKNKQLEGYTSHWHVCRLVYYEVFDDVRNAINREKQLKRWRRDKKIALIENVNLNWHDLSDEWFEEPKVNNKGIAPRLRSG
jgi:putative endonuclease